MDDTVALDGEQDIIPFQNVEQVRDELPQPYRMIQKVLEKCILEPAWDRISAKFPQSEKVTGISKPATGAKILPPQTVYADSVFEGALPEGFKHIMPGNCLDAPLLLTSKGQLTLFLYSPNGVVEAAGEEDGGNSIPLQSLPVFSNPDYAPYDLREIEHLTEGVSVVPEPGRPFLLTAVATKSYEPTPESVEAQEAAADTAAREEGKQDASTGSGQQYNHRGAVEVLAMPLSSASKGDSSKGETDTGKESQPVVLLRWMAPEGKTVSSLSISVTGRFATVGLADGTAHIFLVPIEQLIAGYSDAVAEAAGSAASDEAARAATPAKAKAKKAAPPKGKGKGKKAAAVEEIQALPSLHNARLPSITVTAAVHTTAVSALFGEELKPMVVILEVRDISSLCTVFLLYCGSLVTEDVCSRSQSSNALQIE